jgi:isoquinoline 1-oxidoreductase alpha subunit
MIRLRINEEDQVLDVEPDTPLLWALRDAAGLTGTKYGCGKAQCGACTMHVDGAPTRSCVLPVGNLEGRSITTIEGLDSTIGKAVKAAWIELQVPQCGFCQSGQIMAAAALIQRNLHPSDADIDRALDGNICRCATYQRIRAGIKYAAQSLIVGI